MIVVLDMDECLLHSQFYSPEHDYRQHEEGRPDNADGSPAASSKSSSVETFDLTLPDGDVVVVHKRPDLDAFLASVSSKYETHVFTAAMEVYASPVLDVLDPRGSMLSGRWYRDSCSYDESYQAYAKDLRTIVGSPSSDALRRVVLVDNNPMSFLTQPSNGILVSNFYDDPTDKTLRAVSELLDELDGEEDVRNLLRGRFGIEDALRDMQGTGRKRNDR